MSRNKNKQNKEKTVTDTTDNSTNDLSNDLGDLGALLKASEGIGAEGVSGVGLDSTVDAGAGDVAPSEAPPVLPPTIPADISPPEEFTPSPAASNIADVLNTAAAAAADVVAETAPITDFTTPVKVSTDRIGDTSRVRIQKSIIDTYVDVVAPGKPINWDVMSNHHIKLCKALIESAGYPYIEFKEVYDHLLKQVKEHRAGAFGDLYVRRFDDRLYPKMTKDQIATSDRLISIITTVGRHNDRGRALQQIDLAASLKDVKPALAQQNLSAYFGAFRR